MPIGIARVLFDAALQNSYRYAYWLSARSCPQRKGFRMPIRITRIHRWINSLLLIVIGTASLATALAQGFGPAGPSPATGHASVVATGTVYFSESSARWHVTRHMTEEGGSTYVSTHQGFLIAENTPLLVTLTNGEAVRLAGGEALGISQNTEFNVDTFGAPDTFLFMQALPESAPQLPAASDRLLTSASFDTKDGAYSTSLVRDVLAEGEEGQLPAGVVPTAIYVLVGEIEMSSNRGTINLYQGDSAIFEGDLTITAIADGSVYYAGFIGAELPNVATPVPVEPTAEPATPAPTAEPTAEPTPEPTVEPTAEPTVEPTPTPREGEGDGFTYRNRDVVNA